ncbi:MAG TPA: DMT family transporter [Solirubrobacteraceae bacterium]|nr:DMT family transporter [Solirubrobacteraceae bacterium]
MDRTVALVLAALIGGVLAAQAPLNSALARVVGGVQASVVALGISFAALLALCAVTGGLSGIGRLGEAPLHVAVGGGLIGALYVGSIVWTVRALGAGGLTAATIAGQLALAVVIDHFGWLGVARSPITASKVFGIALLALGTWLVVRD